MTDDQKIVEAKAILMRITRELQDLLATLPEKCDPKARLAIGDAYFAVAAAGGYISVCHTPKSKKRIE